VRSFIYSHMNDPASCPPNGRVAFSHIKDLHPLLFIIQVRPAMPSIPFQLWLCTMQTYHTLEAPKVTIWSLPARSGHSLLGGGILHYECLQNESSYWLWQSPYAVTSHDGEEDGRTHV
jgi:hypothetical protein